MKNRNKTFSRPRVYRNKSVYEGEGSESGGTDFHTQDSKLEPWRSDVDHTTPLYNTESL